MASAAAAKCVGECVAKGSKYTLIIGDKMYQVEPQDKFKGLGGKNVTVKGTMSNDSFTATSVKVTGRRHKKAA